MPSAVKCGSAGVQGDADNPAIDEINKEYDKKLQENCGKIATSGACFAKEARAFNKLIDEIHQLGDKYLSGTVTITVDQALQEYGPSLQADGTASTVSEKVARQVAAGTHGSDSVTTLDVHRRAAAAQLGTRSLSHLGGYPGRAEGSKITYEVANNPGYPNNQVVLLDAAERYRRGYNTPGPSNKRGFQPDADNPTISSKGAQSENTLQNINQLQETLRYAAAALKRGVDDVGGDASVDRGPLSDLQGKLQALKSHLSSESKLSKCAEELDIKGNVELDNKLASLQGVNAVHGPGTPKQRAAANEAINAFSDNQQVMAIPVINYKEQCILLSQISTLAKFSRSLDDSTAKTSDEEGDKKIRRRLPYRKAGAGELVGNAPLLVEGESFGFINRLTTSAAQAGFFSMTTAEISSMQPLIRLYKIQNANSSQPVSEFEIPFDSHANSTDIENIFRTKTKRGFGIGIKSFNLNFEGQDMFAQKRCITATLSLHAADFEELMRPRTVETMDKKGRTVTRTFKYIDLALKTGKNIKQNEYKENDALNFRLKAVFGWANQDAASPIKGTNRSALSNSFVSVNLTPVTHNFDFDELGRVTFNIEYLAYVEEYFATPRLNIFTEVATNVRLLTRKLAFDHANYAICKSGDGGAELQKKVNVIKQDDVKIIGQEKQKMHSHLFKQLFINGYIHFLNFTREDLKGVLAQGPGYPLAGKVTKGSADSQLNLSQKVHAAFSSQISDDQENKIDLGAHLQLAGMDSIQIPFFYIADLLNVVMGSMEQYLSQTADELNKATEYKGLPVDEDMKKMEIKSLNKTIAEFKKFRVVLGPLEIVDHATGDSQHVNFGDVPVSVKYFSEWLTSKILKNNGAQYPLTQFLKDLFNDLLKNYLNEDSCYPFSIKQKVRLYEAVVTSYPTYAPQDEITQRIVGSKNKYRRLVVKNIPTGNPLLNIKGNSDYNNPNPGVESEMNYFIFHAGRTAPSATMIGDKDDDEGRGIMHYVLGRDRGLIKNISLEKTETPHLKTVRFEQDGYDGLHQLRELYDVNIKSYANVGAFPGQYLFVDPRGFAPSTAAMEEDKFDLTDLGVGGYYMITRASHEFGPGHGETNLTAVWVASAGGKTATPSGVGSNKKTKCRKSSSSPPADGAETDTDKEPAPSDPPKDT